MTSVQPLAAPSIVARVKNILMTPKAEWARIDGEPATIQGLYVGYVLILAAIGPICGLIGGQVFGWGGFGISIHLALVPAILVALKAYVGSLIGVAVLAWIIDLLAPNFGAEKNLVQAFKVAVYASTASWLAGIFGLIPALAILGLVGLYSVYLLYAGLPVVMKAPPEKARAYTAVVVLVAIVLALVIGAVAGGLGMGMGMGRLGGTPYGSNARVSGTLNVPGVGSIDVGKAQAAAEKLRAEAEAQRTGSAAKVTPVAVETLSAMLPATVGGFARGDVSTNSTQAGSVSGSNAEATYQQGDHQFTLTVTDMGSMAAIGQLMGAVNVTSSHQSGSSYSKMGRVDGRMTTEEWSDASKRGKYGVMVGERFMVEADGSADMATLKSAVAAVPFGQLEGLAHK